MNSCTASTPAAARRPRFGLDRNTILAVLGGGTILLAAFGAALWSMSPEDASGPALDVPSASQPQAVAIPART